MQHTQLIKTVVISALMLSSNASALELFNNGSSQLDFKGNLSVYYIDNGDISEINDGFSRYTFDMKHNLEDEWQALALLEWGLQLSKTESKIIIDNNGLTSTGPTTETTWLRRGFVGVTHEKYGRFTVGKQWGVSYDVAGVTDWFEIFGAGGQGTYNFGTDGGFSGSGRAEQAIQYKVSVGDFNLGAQYLVSDDVIHSPSDTNPSAGVQFNNAYAMSVIYQAPYGIGLGLAYNQAKVSLIADESQSAQVNDELLTAHITYGPYGQPGLHVAMVFTDMQYHENNDLGRVMEKSQGLELFSAYRFDNNISLILGYNALKDTSPRRNGANNSFHKKYYILSAKYHWSDDFYLFLESKIDDSTYLEVESPLAENATGIGMMFTF